MSQTTLVATPGRATGSSASRRLRAEGKIPAVLYGHGMTPVPLTVDRRDLRTALSGAAGLNTILSLDVDGTTYPAVIKEVQRHPVRRTVNHVDFLQISMSEQITMHVPLHLHGEAKAVLSNGGLVDPAVDTIEIVTTPNNVPAEIVVDVTDLQIGDIVRLGDITLPAGVTATADPDTPIVTVLLTRAEAAAQGEAAGGEEGAGGEPAGEASTPAE